MIRRQNELGEIAVSNNVYTYIAGSAATNCFGVKGMAIRSMKDGLVHLLRRESLAKGVLVRTNEDGTISVDLHIIVIATPNDLHRQIAIEAIRAGLCAAAVCLVVTTLRKRWYGGYMADLETLMDCVCEEEAA